MNKYHISSSGNVVKCRAVKTACKAQPPEGYEQFHSEIEFEVYDVISRQYHDILEGIKRPRLPKKFVVTDELIGSPDTDVERLSVSSEHNKPFGKVSHIWLSDTEGHPIAYIKVSQEEKGLYLYDIEVREEFRGHGLSKRIIKAVEKNTGMKMKHEGGYTPEGLRSVAPLFHDEKWIEEEKERTFSSMKFVTDWDTKMPKYVA